MLPYEPCTLRAHTLLAIPVKIIDSAAMVVELINGLSDLPVDPPSLFIDLEGENLSRTGPILIVTLFVEPQKMIYLIDVWVLRGLAFTTSGKDGKTMKDILESASIQKVFFDVRNDFEALRGQYGISLQGVQDVQLMEEALHPIQFPAKPLTGLAKCIEKDVSIPYRIKMVWSEQKSKGKEMFKGGSFKAFKARPLPKDTVAYCTGDVQYLPALRKTYWDRLSPVGKTRAKAETRLRVCLPAMTQIPDSSPLQTRQARNLVGYNLPDEDLEDHGFTTKAIGNWDWDW